MYNKHFFRLSILSMLILPLAHGETNLDDKLGYYQVQQSFLSTKNCDSATKPVEYASQFLLLKSTDYEQGGYSVSTCDGEELEELQCNGYFNTTALTTQTKYGFEGYFFNARKRKAKDGTPQCMFTALRRRVAPGKGDFIRYERTDWGSLLADYNFECTREMAKTFFEAQSLKCSTHIVIDAVKVEQR